ncbi:MAG: type II secretion system F family protein [Cellulomonadaceae bacterium]|jgi:pilus assembly protein TadC|nr:type II secretion system F family protein [Cellulomonadaceae bacterium]
MFFWIFCAAVLTAVPWWLLRAEPVERRLSVRPGLARESDPSFSIPIVLELLATALSVGVAIPRALAATGQAIGGATGIDLKRAGRRLEFGSDWREAWEDAPPSFAIISDALRPAWEEGAAATDALRAAGQAARSAHQDAARVTAGKLGVRLVLPLGLCLLPAFVLIGLVPMLLSLGTGLLTGG